MVGYKIQFLPYTPGSKVHCPACRKGKTLTRYVNIESGEIYPPEFGRCDRETSCGYNSRPDVECQTTIEVAAPIPSKPIDYIDVSEVEARERNAGPNSFFTFLKSVVGPEKFHALKRDYRLGTSLKHPSFVSFPQIDMEGRVRRIKEMGYNDKTGSRLKSTGSQRWAFEAWEYSDLNLQQCFFGLHLVKANSKPVAIVESEKTALICGAFIPKYIWIATGSLGMLSSERCMPLEGREVVLFPDAGSAYSKWKRKAKWIKGLKSLKVSDYLERSNIGEGLDLADVLISPKNY